MSKKDTPTIVFENHPSLTIAHLKQWGYLQPNQSNCGTRELPYSLGRCIIYLYVNLSGIKPYLELLYWYRGEHISSIVKLVSCPSNLGKGRLWYFVCPRTGKRCRRLYWIGRHFGHRDAADGAVYEKQTYSRQIRALYREEVEREEVLDLLCSKYIKKQYRGQVTRRYLALLKKLKRRGF